MNNEFIENRNVMCFQFSLKRHHLQDVITNPYHVIVPHIHQFIHEISALSDIWYLFPTATRNSLALLLSGIPPL